MDLTPNELKVHQAYQYEVHLWIIRGVDGLWPNKEIAERVARIHFPNEDPNYRYSRIYYTRFVRDC